MSISASQPLFESSIPGIPPPRRGKVRDVYDFGDRLLLVATDRISAFDVVFPTPIADKGRVLTGLTLFWLNRLAGVVANHLISATDFGLTLAPEVGAMLAGRSLLVKKTEVLPFEFIVRGYIIGSGWKEYQLNGEVCGIPLPSGLKLADRLAEPIFTPSTKAEAGHDQNVTFPYVANHIGAELAGRLRDVSLALYRQAASLAESRGIIIADSKFEFGLHQGELTLIDEVLTPDSSRFWARDLWNPGGSPPSFDKQYLRDWLEKESGWNKEPPAPSLPPAVIDETRERYLDAYLRLTGSPLAT
ncbi:MAG: phosphoribosylaminoimidazolesuccinocarboxamide synthase [Planctomycetota bacterium]|jgi:phosphoribosylaminoimidazole-succinocarboxamide synthase|nr:phosphoribosylaminoimidazolesuccinocarboxamide synthase [Planctomycetota bacterium]